MVQYSVYTDGGSRGNPGISAYAFVIFDSNIEIYSSSGFLGISTNNKAEYTALLTALKYIVSKIQESNIDLTITNYTLYSDSELMVKQIKGEYKVKDEDLKILYLECKELIKKIANFKIEHVRREKNKRADFLVNKVLDEQ